MYYKQGRASIAAACFPFLKAKLPWSQHTMAISTSCQLMSELITAQVSSTPQPSAFLLRPCQQASLL